MVVTTAIIVEIVEKEYCLLLFPAQMELWMIIPHALPCQAVMSPISIGQTTTTTTHLFQQDRLLLLLLLLHHRRPSTIHHRITHHFNFLHVCCRGTFQAMREKAGYSYTNKHSWQLFICWGWKLRAFNTPSFQEEAKSVVCLYYINTQKAPSNKKKHSLYQS